MTIISYFNNNILFHFIILCLLELPTCAIPVANEVARDNGGSLTEDADRVCSPLKYDIKYMMCSPNL